MGKRNTRPIRIRVTGHVTDDGCQVVHMIVYTRGRKLGTGFHFPPKVFETVPHLLPTTAQGLRTAWRQLRHGWRLYCHGANYQERRAIERMKRLDLAHFDKFEAPLLGPFNAPRERQKRERELDARYGETPARIDWDPQQTRGSH